MEKRENNLVLFNAPESSKQNAQENQNEEEVKFTSFCVNGLELPADCLPKVDKFFPAGKTQHRPECSTAGNEGTFDEQGR